MTSSALVLGATGLCGASFLRVASQSSAIDKIIALTRRPLRSTPAKVDSVVEDITPQSSVPGTDIVFSSLSTTKAAAGGFDAQYKIDHDLNVDLAKTAKVNGAKVFILISSSGANCDSMLPYLRLKGDCERDIIALGFDKTIILRPGVLLGDREGTHKGFGNSLGMKVGGWVYNSPVGFIAGHPAYGDDVARVGLDMALNESNGVHIIGGADLVNKARKLAPQ